MLKKALALAVTALLLVGMLPQVALAKDGYTADNCANSDDVHILLKQPVVQPQDVTVGSVELENPQNSEAYETFQTFTIGKVEAGDIVWVPFAVKPNVTLGGIQAAVAYDSERFTPYLGERDNSTDEHYVINPAFCREIGDKTADEIEFEEAIQKAVKQGRDWDMPNEKMEPASDDPLHTSENALISQLYLDIPDGMSLARPGAGTNEETLLYFRFKANFGGPIRPSDFYLAGESILYDENIEQLTPLIRRYISSPTNNDITKYLYNELNLPKYAESVAPATMNVKLGTALSAIQSAAPATADVTWSDGTTTGVDVTWDFTQASPAIPTIDVKHGTYTVPGTLTPGSGENLEDVTTATLTVTVDQATITGITTDKQFYYQGEYRLFEGDDISDLSKNIQLTVEGYAGSTPLTTYGVGWIIDDINFDVIDTYTVSGSLFEVKGGDAIYEDNDEENKDKDFALSEGTALSREVEIIAQPEIVADVAANGVNHTQLDDVTLGSATEQQVADALRAQTVTGTLTKNTHYNDTANVTLPLGDSYTIEAQGATWTFDSTLTAAVRGGGDAGAFSNVAGAVNVFTTVITADTQILDGDAAMTLLENGDSKKLTVQVTFAGTAIAADDLTKPADVNVANGTDQASLSLPSTIAFTDGTIAVTAWTPVTSYDEATPGTYAFKPTFGAITPANDGDGLPYYLADGLADAANAQVNVKVHGKMTAGVTYDTPIAIALKDDTDKTLADEAEIERQLNALTTAVTVPTSAYTKHSDVTGDLTVPVGAASADWTMTGSIAPGATLTLSRTITDGELSLNQGSNFNQSVLANGQTLTVTVTLSKEDVTADSIQAAMADKAAVDVAYGTDETTAMGQLPTGDITISQNGKSMTATIGAWTAQGTYASTTGAYAYTAPLTVKDSKSDLVLPADASVTATIYVLSQLDADVESAMPVPMEQIAKDENHLANFQTWLAANGTVTINEGTAYTDPGDRIANSTTIAPTGTWSFDETLTLAARQEVNPEETSGALTVDVDAINVFTMPIADNLIAENSDALVKIGANGKKVIMTLTLSGVPYTGADVDTPFVYGSETAPAVTVPYGTTQDEVAALIDEYLAQQTVTQDDLTSNIAKKADSAWTPTTTYDPVGSADTASYYTFEAPVVLSGSALYVEDGTKAQVVIRVDAAEKVTPVTQKLSVTYMSDKTAISEDLWSRFEGNTILAETAEGDTVPVAVSAADAAALLAMMTDVNPLPDATETDRPVYDMEGDKVVYSYTIPTANLSVELPYVLSGDLTVEVTLEDEVKLFAIGDVTAGAGKITLDTLAKTATSEQTALSSYTVLVTVTNSDGSMRVVSQEFTAEEMDAAVSAGTLDVTVEGVTANSKVRAIITGEFVTDTDRIAVAYSNPVAN